MGLPCFTSVMHSAAVRTAVMENHLSGDGLKTPQHFFIWGSDRKTLLTCSPFFISNKRGCLTSLPVWLLASTHSLSPFCRSERGESVTQHFALIGINITGLTDANNWKLTSLGTKLILVCFNCKAVNCWAWIKAYFGKGYVCNHGLGGRLLHFLFANITAEELIKYLFG